MRRPTFRQTAIDATLSTSSEATQETYSPELVYFSLTSVTNALRDTEDVVSMRIALFSPDES